MEDPVHLAVVMERTDVDKLSKLTSDKIPPSEYLAYLIRLLHEEQQARGCAIDPESLVYEIRVLVERRNRLEQRVLSLGRRLDELLAEYVELLSRVPTLAHFVGRRVGRLSH